MAEGQSELAPNQVEDGVPSIETTSTEDLVAIPIDRCHDSGNHVSILSILIALTIAVVGGAGLGAGYGAFQALCGEHLVNLGLFCSIPF